MTYTLRTTPQKGYLLVELDGAVDSISEIIEYTVTFVAEAERLDLHKVLVDERNAFFTLDFMDLVKLAEHASERDFHLKGFRIASLPHPDMLDKHKAFETAVRNRSIEYRVFTSEDDALDWLLR